MVGGDAGWTWVHAATSRRTGRSVAARLLRNAGAVHKRYGAPPGATIYVIKKGVCRREYGASDARPSRACVLKGIQKRL
ncbi:hypothetical protein ACIBQX_37490 [Nonomuraea sp. NPDC049714]|uniref:hypothetical protein n=1 Tax=Nonomuraea sp. NPDC049714 TaxID=3364357 RepID=UPI0037AF931C